MNLYNPLNKDFSITYDINKDKKPKTFTVPSKEIVTFDEPVASHVRKHLANAVLNENYKTKYAVDLQLKAINEEITINLDD